MGSTFSASCSARCIDAGPESNVFSIHSTSFDMDLIHESNGSTSVSKGLLLVIGVLVFVVVGEVGVARSIVQVHFGAGVDYG